MATTSGSLLKMASSDLPKNRITVMAAANVITPSSRHSSSVFLQRRSSPAPKFCPTKVVQA